MKIIISLLLCLSASFATAQISQNAIDKNNQAIGIVKRYISDSDSLNKAIRLLDEAIAIDSLYQTAYTNKARYLMYLGEKEKALDTLLQVEKLGQQKSNYFVLKGLFLEENDKKELALEAYKQAIFLLEASLNEKPVEGELLNYVNVLSLRDNKRYTLDDVEKKYPNVIRPGTKEAMEEMMNGLRNRSRKELIHEAVSR